jgi:hypothetical protein
MQLTTIDEVLGQLDHIIDVARQRGSTDGYFAALYRRVTAEVKARVAAGAFEDNERMAKFDVAFASRYIAAWNEQERGGKPTAAWGLALGCTRKYWPVVLQHFILGMNAHINLDLGIVAAQIAPGDSILGLKNDFDSINQLLADLVDDVQDRLAEVWPVMKLIRRVGGHVDDAVINFSIGRARAHAWAMAQEMAVITDDRARTSYIGGVDSTMSILGGLVLNPGIQGSMILAMVRLRERGSVSEKLDILLR